MYVFVCVPWCHFLFGCWTEAMHVGQSRYCSEHTHFHVFYTRIYDRHYCSVSISVSLLLDHFHPCFLSLQNFSQYCFALLSTLSPSLISSFCLSIKDVEEVCHLICLPPGPFIFFKQESAKANPGFRCLLFFAMSCPTNQFFPLLLAEMLFWWKKCALQIEIYLTLKCVEPVFFFLTGGQDTRRALN